MLRFRTSNGLVKSLLFLLRFILIMQLWIQNILDFQKWHSKVNHHLGSGLSIIRCSISLIVGIHLLMEDICGKLFSTNSMEISFHCCGKQYFLNVESLFFQEFCGKLNSTYGKGFSTNSMESNFHFYGKQDRGKINSTKLWK